MTSALLSPLDAYELIQSEANIKIFDATYPPNIDSPCLTDAIIFDIDDIADPHSSMPHMAPSAEIFATKMQALGVKNSDTIIIYDAYGIHMAAARAWWMMRLFSHENVRVINGGLKAWAQAGLPLVAHHKTPHPINTLYHAELQKHLIVNLDEMKDIVETDSAMILDARPPERFLGLSPEPRPKMRAGHMPHAINIPTGSLLDPTTGGMKETPPLPTFDSNQKIVTSCGSGVTACVIALALFEKSKKDVAIYDGSWAEWGNEALNLPIVKSAP